MNVLLRIRAAVGFLRLPILLTAAAAVLLAVRFLSGVALVGMSLTNEAGRAATAAVDAYEIVVAILLTLFAGFLILRTTGQANRRWAVASTLALAGALALWLPTILLPALLAVFAAAGVVALALATPVADALQIRTNAEPRRWSSVAFLGFLFLLPVAFGMRSLARLGMVSGNEPVGWFLVIAPTLFLELFSITVWMNLAIGERRGGRPRRGVPYVPFLFIPLFLFLFEGRPLTGYIFSAVVNWGANLPLFVPVSYARGLAVTAVACYASSILLLPPGPRRRLLALGTALAVLSGYYLSMASVAGLALSLVTVSLALAPDYPAGGGGQSSGNDGSSAGCGGGQTPT